VIGQTLGHYRVREQIGAGGMGLVFRAHDERLDRDVALKVLPPGTITDENARRRFHKEALTLSKLNHPNIETVFDFDSQEGVDFLVMELISGATLDEKLKAAALPEKEVIRLGMQLAEGLTAAHAEGVIHRDLKPGNLRLTPDGRLKILDFGLAKLLGPVSDAAVTQSLSQTRGAVGTLPYMAPEQLRSEPADTRSDVWAAGAVLYEMATGKRPFAQSSAPMLTDAILRQATVPPRALNPNLSPELERILSKALEKDPEHRYQSAKELGADLRRLAVSQTAAPLLAVAPERKGLPRAGMVAAASVVALLAVVLGTLVLLRQRPAPGGGPPRIESLAVLPLENLSRDPEQEYFADGMTEELTTSLAQVSALRVISRTSVMRYKGTKKPLPEIARELNVDAVVEGSVLRWGNRVRITAQLIDARADRHLWSQSYERDLHDVLALQDEVARAIAAAIKIKLTPQEELHLTSARSVNPEAYELYLKGRYHWNKRTEEELKKGIEYFQEAIEKDPNYAQAYSGLADAYIVLNLRGYTSPKETNASAKSAATKALAIDSTLAEAHTSLARVLANNWDWPAADVEFKRAIELNPGYLEAHHAYSHYLIAMGRTAESLTESKRALQLAPLDTTMGEHLGWHYLMAREVDQSIDANRKVLDLDPNTTLAHYILGQAYEEKSMYTEAIAEFQRAVTLSNGAPETLMGLGHAYAVAGKKGEALKIRGQLVALSKQRYVSPVYMALICTGLGEKDQAFTWLNKAYEERSAMLIYLKLEPRLDPLRSDPRFADLLRRVGLPQ